MHPSSVPSPTTDFFKFTIGFLTFITLSFTLTFVVNSYTITQQREEAAAAALAVMLGE